MIDSGTGDSPLALLRQIIDVEPPDLNELKPGVEPELRAATVDAGFSGGAQERVRVSTFEWGPDAKQRIVTAAREN